jgi:sugar/nucleoside kinase (ribokinase family)
VDPALAEAFPEASLGLAAQGWLRRWEADGLVSPARWEPGPLLRRAQVLVVSRQDIAGQEEAAVDWFQQVPVGAVTLGRQGALLYVNGERYHVAPDAAREVDPTGAGDVFAAVLLVEYHRTGDPWEAAAAAACAAAAAVEGTGAAALPDRAALEERLAAYRRRRGG